MLTHSFIDFSPWLLGPIALSLWAMLHDLFVIFILLLQPLAATLSKPSQWASSP
jgi:hypothetical protein